MDANCLNCKHHKLAGKVIECHHPQRPPAIREVVRWFAGCKQHQPKENA